MGKSKEPIRLRQRKRPSGIINLYLDIYIDGKRSYENLKLYLIPEKTRADKEKNKETLKLADAIRAKRVVELQNGQYGFDSAYKTDTRFFDYYEAMCEKRHRNPGSLGNWGNWWGALQYLKRYARPDITFKEITPQWIQGFKDYLDTTARVRDKRKRSFTTEDLKPLSQNTKQSYFNKLRACINQAYEDRIIPHNPLRGIEGFKAEERERLYLTLDEVRAMAAAECKYPVLKRAFMFSCLTGLRKSDIEKMRWKEVRKQGDFTRIVFRQKKTGGQEYIDINPQAVEYLGERGDDDSLVFTNFSYSSYYLMELKRWAVRAGITKDITFHSGRHTFAVLMLDLGADIYTVQKLLGHREIHTTQIYAKVMDKKKQEAALLIPQIKFPDASSTEEEKE
ncbi:MAG: site-specific integrase [Bacteroidaceae bacterium]|nr:site-specific integrase [Bacteroidaceae bacterium]